MGSLLRKLPCTRFPTSFGRLVSTGWRHFKKYIVLMMALAVLTMTACVLKGVVNMTADLITNLIVSIGVAAGSRVQGSSRQFVQRVILCRRRNLNPHDPG